MITILNVYPHNIIPHIFAHMPKLTDNKFRMKTDNYK